MGRIYRLARREELPTADVYRLALVLSMIGKLIETSDLEARLSKLEAAHEAKRGPRRLAP